MDENLICIKKQKETLQLLTYNQNMSKNLMLDLLDLAQTDSNTFKVNSDNFSLLDVIKHAFKLVSHIASVKQVELVLPLITDQMMKVFSRINSDKNRIQQVFVNLLSNSLKFSNTNSRIEVNLKLLEMHRVASK